jgi:cytochrome c
MVAGIAQNMMGSDKSADEAIAISSTCKVCHIIGGKSNKTCTLVATCNSFNPLTVKKASDAEYDDYIAKISSSSASGTNMELEEIANEEVFQH